jgi:hypothetical protein
VRSKSSSMTTARRQPANRSQDRAHKRKRCIDCVDEGVLTSRKAAYPGPRCATHHRARKTKRKSTNQEQRWMSTYGITADEYWAIYRYQLGKCFVCERATGARKALSVDHCHATGIVRGLLCSTCNSRVLGHLRDDTAALERAIDYLNRPPAVRVIGKKVVPNFDR